MSKIPGKAYKDSRVVAVLAVAEVLAQEASLTDALARHQLQLTVRDRAFAQELSFGSCRYALSIEAAILPFMRKANTDPMVRALFIIGCYQLLVMRTPAHAAVSSTVEAAKLLQLQPVAGFLNAVLRKAADVELPELESHPAWLKERFQQDWPNDWQNIIKANDERPPFTIRVNRQFNTREQYQTALMLNAIEAQPVAEDGLILDKPIPVKDLPGFDEGHASVQDAAAQLAATTLAPKNGELILDACAAPGGKTCHMLEIAPEAEMIALDIDEERLDRVEENLERLGQTATIRPADICEPEVLQDYQFDAILLDAPCSATGVIRRHPDIRLLRRDSDLPELAKTQVELLQACWQRLKPGGRLLYATCSVIRQENEAVMRKFRKLQKDVETVEIANMNGDYGRMILPGEEGMDGFYLALMRKPSL